ncbi:hypothetical protein KUTeg_007374 [Tegillarca granosa]|uniref:DDE-1 domain-containing protein n=1 Tax=Tegillarca granosa TaxID=220873 RepID=A0ABQ9FD39_TEGGR|nr:hypothetical protein KUTeg_007374 [Tegillarca granosa]
MATPPIFSFFKKVDKAGLPVATSPSFQAANKEVSSVMATNSGGKSASGGKGRKRKYGAYSPETRAKIARYAIENGNTAAAKHYTTVLKTDISESTVRGMKASYQKMKKMQGKAELISSLPKFVEKVIVPYVDRTIDENDLPLRQRALCVFNIYTALRGEELKQLLFDKNIQIVYVPASCTDKLQPLDLGINAPFKASMRAQFEDYYAEEVKKQLQNEVALKDVKVDLRLSVIKPLHAKWIVKSVDDLIKNPDQVKSSWTMAGLS